MLVSASAPKSHLCTKKGKKACLLTYTRCTATTGAEGGMFVCAFAGWFVSIQMKCIQLVKSSYSYKNSTCTNYRCTVSICGMLFLLCVFSALKFRSSYITAILGCFNLLLFLFNFLTCAVVFSPTMKPCMSDRRFMSQQSIG